MKNIKIKNLTLNNFKGIKNASFDFNDKGVVIVGDNGTGKTTIIDAFLWLLFNKNSQNITDFSVKPIDKDGNVLHNADYSVEATFEITETNGIFDDKKEITLKKVMREKWQKKRGDKTTTFTGHETSYFKNDTPKLLKEYQAEVENLCKEDLFRMLTAPFYFNHLDKKVKRDTLLKAVPNIADIDVVEKDVRFLPLLEGLKNLTIEEMIARSKAQIATINKQLPSFGYKIEELVQMTTTESDEIDNQNLKEIKVKIDEQKVYIDSLKEQRNSKTNIDELLALKKKLSNVSDRYYAASIRNPLKIEKQTLVSSLQNQLCDLRNELSKVKNEKVQNILDASKYASELSGWEKDLETTLKQIEIAHKKCEAIDSEEYQGSCDCPTCGQRLPQNKINEAIEMFNLDKASRLEKAISLGKALKADKATIEAKIEFLKQNAIISRENEINGKIVEIEAQIKETEVNIKVAEDDLINVGESEEMLNLKEEERRLKEEIQSLTNKSTSAPDLGFKIKVEEDNLDDLYSQKATYERNIANRERIKELELEQQNLSNNLQIQQDTLYLCEDFLKEKVKMIEKQVNGLFSKVQFTMFREQINGAYEEVCYATIDGVPFDDANNASKINAGLDIIKTLQKVYDVKAPIFIDNAESVTNFEELEDTQTIKLYVKEGANLEIIKKGE